MSISAISLSGSENQVYACEASPPGAPSQAMIDNSAAVFSGKVVKFENVTLEDPAGDKRIAFFEVDRYWKTLEWLHDEVGGAFMLNKPVLVLADYEVQVGGLPSVNPHWVLPFDTNNLQAVKRDLATRMPRFREEVARKKNGEFWQNLGKGAVLVGAGVLIGLVVRGSGKRRR